MIFNHLEIKRFIENNNNDYLKLIEILDIKSYETITDENISDISNMIMNSIDESVKKILNSYNIYEGFRKLLINVDPEPELNLEYIINKIIENEDIIREKFFKER